MIGRGILLAVNNGGKFQRLQFEVLKDDIMTDVTRLQEYGFETKPLAGAEILALFVNGNRDQGVVVCVADKRYRPNYLGDGDVCIYTLNDKTNPHRIWFYSTGEGTYIDAKADIELFISSLHKILTKDFTVQDSGGAGTFLIHLGSQNSSEPLVLGNAFKAFFDAHLHATPVGPSGPPTILMNTATVELSTIAFTEE